VLPVEPVLPLPVGSGPLVLVLLADPAPLLLVGAAVDASLVSVTVVPLVLASVLPADTSPDGPPPQAISHAMLAPHSQCRIVRPPRRDLREPRRGRQFAARDHARVCPGPTRANSHARVPARCARRLALR
jgi:hypothetical protein